MKLFVYSVTSVYCIIVYIFVVYFIEFRCVCKVFIP